MRIDLSGRTILITGASRGVGAAIARACAKAGARVLIHYATNAGAALKLAKELGAPQQDVLGADLADAGAAQALWEAAAARAPRLDALVNNAGVFEAIGLNAEACPWDAAWARTLQVNLKAPADLCRLAVAHFQSHGGGRIVNIASRAGHRGDDPEHLAYAASKGGLLALTKSLARAFASDNILAFAIAPGWVATDMGPQTETERRRARREIPLGRVAEADEIGALAAFLLSDLCSSATGATFDVNGASYVR